ncbi:uncharacterized protein LOC141907685 [Tubulanus polymorphus]|uniref:uncharacterized protein LOC141907685 n=1 Tax=Tubulanus polymorphus TaxID=672921 RepID=UPI003DA2B949
MAQPQQEGIKEKVQAVREVVLGRSNNEIVLVLQYYDYSVECAIQAFVEDGAKAALEEWQFSGNKTKSNKGRNNRKKKNKPKVDTEEGTDHNANTTAAIDIHTEIQDLEGVHSADEGATAVSNIDDASAPKPDLPALLHDISSEPEHKVKQPELKPTNSPLPVKDIVKGKPTERKNEARIISSRPTHKNNARHVSPRRHNRKSESSSDHRSQTQTLMHEEKMRERTTSECSNSSIISSPGRHKGLEKSVKDLHRQTVSLQRLKMIFGDEIDRSYKRIKSVFDLIKKELEEQESQLRTEVAQVKLAGDSILSSRQEKAVDLKIKTERAQTMNDAQLSELRAEIKHFVSDRKIDEELCHATRFFHDSDPLLEIIKTFGKVVPVRAAYSLRRPSDSPADSDKTPLKLSTDAYSMQTNISSGEIVSSTSMSTSEIAELHQRLNKSLQLQGLPSKEKPRSPTRPVSSRNNQRSPSRLQSSPSRTNRNGPNPKSSNRPQGNSSRSPRRPVSSTHKAANPPQTSSQLDSRRPQKSAEKPQPTGQKESDESRSPEKRTPNRNAQRRQRFRERRQRESLEISDLIHSKPFTEGNEGKGDTKSPQRQSKQEIGDSPSKQVLNDSENAATNVSLPQRQPKSPRHERKPIKTSLNGIAQPEKFISTTANGLSGDSKPVVDEGKRIAIQNGTTQVAVNKGLESEKRSTKTNGTILVNGDMNHINGHISH